MKASRWHGHLLPPRTSPCVCSPSKHRAASTVDCRLISRPLELLLVKEKEKKQLKIQIEDNACLNGIRKTKQRRLTHQVVKKKLELK